MIPQEIKALGLWLLKIAMEGLIQTILMPCSAFDGRPVDGICLSRPALLKRLLSIYNFHAFLGIWNLETVFLIAKLVNDSYRDYEIGSQTHELSVPRVVLCL